MTLASVSRWGFAKDTIAALLPHADRALDWIRNYGDKDGDGFVEYERLNYKGLISQAWKDSWDGANCADGRIAEPPIALCEVQFFEEVRETEVTHEYWVLMARRWNREKKTQHATEEMNERILYCLRRR